MTKKSKSNDPCWDGYKQIGMKKKNGKKVPNCVPESNFSKELAEEIIVTFYSRPISENTDNEKRQLQKLLVMALESYVTDEGLQEAEYKGKTVTLNKPMTGDVKKFKVYTKDPKTGNVKKVNFGDPNMEIKRDDPERRKAFRARHGCGTDRTSDKTKAGYWSCKMWSNKPVSKIIKGK